MKRIATMAMFCVALAGCGADAPPPAVDVQPPAPTQPMKSTATPRNPGVRPAPDLLGSPKLRVQPDEPTHPIGVDFIAEARRCLASGDSKGYQSAIDRYNIILKRDENPFTIARVSRDTVTYRSADGQEHTVSGWTDALPE